MPKRIPKAVRQSIVVTGISMSAYIGVYPNEKRAPQPLVVDLALEVDWLSAAQSDELSLTLDYQRLCALASEVAAEHHRNLIETLAYEIALRLLEEPTVSRARVTVHKPGAVPQARDTSVTIELEG